MPTAYFMDQVDRILNLSILLDDGADLEKLKRLAHCYGVNIEIDIPEKASPEDYWTASMILFGTHPR